MITHNLIQGSQEWHEHRANHFTASECPAMLGLSKYQTRNALLQMKATGISPEVGPATQSLFDRGHAAEAAARSIAESIIGQDLYPITATLVVDGVPLLASFDGVSMDEEIIFEHKLFNKALANSIEDAKTGWTDGDANYSHYIDPHYRAQMDQQLLVSGAKKCLFMTSDGTAENMSWCWYEPNESAVDEIINGWTQFAIDLAAFVPAEAIPAAIAAPTMALPALSIQVNGSISLISNLDRFGAELKAFVGQIDMAPTDDQGFADAEAACKTLQQAQDALESAEASALAQTASIDDMRRAVKLYADTARTARLALEKMVKSRKESIRVEIATAARDAFIAHVSMLNNRLKTVQLPPISSDFAGVMKGKKMLASLRDAADTELARLKIEANALADKIEINLNSLAELAKDHKFLFADFAQIVGKANDDLVALIKMRIADHKAAEEKRIEAERQRIRQEEESKARAKAEAEAAEKVKADSSRPAVMGGSLKMVKPERPTDAEIIGALAVRFGVSEQTVMGWLTDMNLEQAA